MCCLKVTRAIKGVGVHKSGLTIDILFYNRVESDIGCGDFASPMNHYVPKVARRPTCVLSSSLGLEKMIHWVREASEQKQKKLYFFH